MSGGIPRQHLRLGKVVGESDEGLTLFVPKQEDGTFQLSDGDAFLTLIFTRAAGDGSGAMETWLPWEGL